MLDPHRPLHSKQLDIIAYDRTSASPVFKNGDLVVVRPSSTLSVTEVKKTLRFHDIEQTIDSTFYSNLGSKSSAGNFEGVQSVNIFGFASKLKPEETAKKFRDYLDKKIQYTHVFAKPIKQTVSITIEKVVLPNVFIRNDRCFIMSHLVPTKDLTNFKVTVDVNESQEKNGCMGAFLLAALPMLVQEQTTFIGSELLVVKKSFETEAFLVLRTKTSMHEIDDAFPNDRAAIRQFRVKGKQPFAVMIPKGLHWKTMNSFAEFVQRVGEQAFETGTGSEDSR